MGLPIDPSMLMNMGQPPQPGNDPNDPVVKMFLNSMGSGGGTPPSPDGMNAPAPAPSGNASPISSLIPQPPTPAMAKPVAVGNPAAAPHQPGLFKRMLMDFAYGGAQALKHQLGMPTDEELDQQNQQEAAKAAAAKLAQTKADTEAQKQRLAEAAMDNEDIAPQLKALGMTLPDGATIMVPRKYAAAEIKQRLANIPKEGANAIKAQGTQLNAAKLGYSINPDGSLTPMQDAQLSPMQRGAIELQNATVKLKQAQTDLATNPDNPINKIKLQVAQANMARADASLRNQEARTQIARDSLNFRMGQNFGDPNDPNNQYAQLTSNGQKILSETAPVKEQIVDLMNRMEQAGLDKVTTPGVLAKSRIKYALGFGGPGDELGSEISNLSLAKVTSVARAMRGQRGQYIWKEAEKHTPNLMLDSGWQIHNKLGTLLQMLDRTEQSAIQYERKGGVVPIPRPNRNDMPPIQRREATQGERDGW